jgi:hypothetical protein
MTDRQWAEIIAWLQKTGQQLIVPLTGPIIICKKRDTVAGTGLVEGADPIL